VIKTRVSQSMEITKKYEGKKNKEELLEMGKRLP